MLVRRIYVIMFTTIIFILVSLQKVYEEKMPVVCSFPQKKEKLIALTFDDGPHPEYTQKIVDILNSYGINATFFLVGKQIEKHPELVKYIVENSMSKIGNHTYSHKNLAKISDSEIEYELLKTKEILESIVDENHKDKIISYFRPPGGHYNYKVLSVAEKLGYKIVLWSVFTNDHQTNITPQQLLDKIFSSLQCDKEIILLHSGNKTTLECLPQIIEELTKRGYKFVTVDTLLQRNETIIVN